MPGEFITHRIFFCINPLNLAGDQRQQILARHTQQQLIWNKTPVQLTHREAALLFHLSEKRNAVLDRTFILKKLWGDDDFFNARSMDVFISKLRKKLKNDPKIQIVNVRGFGYKLIC